MVLEEGGGGCTNQEFQADEKSEVVRMLLFFGNFSKQDDGY